ncbi:MAG: hypothetical protein GY779_03295 [Gammaproteobacteria bacterium]|nr:hypothetical protein [Gammaproteobacteria bacterium]
MPKDKNPVMIVWQDSHSPDEGPWIDLDAINHKALEIISVGFVIKKTKKSITIAATVSGQTGQVSGVMCIPKCAILKKIKSSYKVK